MRSAFMRRVLVTSGATTAAVAMLAAAAPVARADLPSSINQTPTGPGTERVSRTGKPVGTHEGIEAAAGIGSGFSDTYGLGLQGRLGYTMRDNLYLGGQVQYFIGHSINDNQAHATFVGGEVGYKIFPTRHIEVRPYAFVGPAWINQVNSPTDSESKVDLGVQPGILAAYRFGNVFLGGDAHYMVTPTPNALAVLANAGLGF